MVSGIGSNSSIDYSIVPNAMAQALKEFSQSIEIIYKTTVCGMKVYNPDYPGLDKIDMKKMPFDIDKEFEKYIKKKGCNNEEELQALSKTNFLNVSCLKQAACEKLRKSLEKLNLGEIGADKINALAIWAPLNFKHLSSTIGRLNIKIPCL